MRGRAFALLAALALAACRTPPPNVRALAADDPRPAQRVAALRELASQRHALRASARAESSGPGGASFSSQLLLVERPACLRVEVIGLLQQRVLVMATDGVRYELYRAEGPQHEEGPVHPGVLAEVAGLPLTPEAAVSLLLAAPLAPDEPPLRAHEDDAGVLSVEWPDQTLAFDAAGRLVSLRFHPGERGERDVLTAAWSDFRDTPAGAFPHRLELALPETGASLTLAYRSVELDPVLDPALFRLGLGTR